MPPADDREPRNVARKLIESHLLDGEMAPGEEVSIRLDEQHCLLATLPETTFFRRYREVFVH